MSVFVHPQGLCESDDVGEGTRVWAFAHVLPGATVGRDCNICDGAFVEGGAVVGDRVTLKNAVLVWDGVTIEDEVFVGPGTVFTNDLRPRSRAPFTLGRTLVRSGATLGANCTVVCGLTVGRFAFVAAGAVVTKDVADHALVVGNPGRQVGWVCECGERLPDSLRCGCGRSYTQAADGLVRQD
jgi:UDP-2-acetamido-3-amino-2,3-dideoxy-glucuronate N-acetyltransferase